jgi:heparinase II/III-like protein
VKPGTRLGWYWYRLRAMDAGEITERVLATARGWTAQSASRVLDGFRISDPVSTCPRLPNRLEAFENIREALRGEAASIHEGRWLLFGWKEVHVSSPPIWHRDYAHGADAPYGIEARCLNHRHLAGGVDARSVWETNRWAEMVRLVQNAWLNGVLDDARLAQGWLLDWCEKNPPRIGINWCSALEAGLRLINFCWIDALVRDCGDDDLTTMQNRLAQQIVPSHAWWIWRHRSFGSSANNHLLGELASLVLAAARWPSLGRVACSAEQAWERIVPEIMRQFAEDGGNREQALHYHQFAWEMAWQAARVMEGGRGPSAERLSKAARFFCDLVHDREPWDFGDSDDGQLTPLTSARRTALAEWKAWFLGKEQGAALQFWFGDPPPNVLPLRTGQWMEYPVTGLAVMEVNGWKARVDGSPLGFGSLAAHGHLDAMHVSLWDGEHALVVDPGTGAYFGDPELRRKLASWELHNGPLPLGGRARPHRMGPFIWADHHSTPRLTLDNESCSVRFVCVGSPIKRTVQWSAEADAWRVTDEISGDEVHVVRWRLAPEWCPVPPLAPGITLAHTKGAAVTLTVMSDGLIGCEMGEDVVSPHFGDLRQGVVITVTFKKRLVSQWQRAEATRQR